MKQLFILFFGIFSLVAYADPNEIVLRPDSPDHDRTGNSLFFDIPQAYYDEDPKTHEIIIVGGGAVSYYDVEISSPITSTVEISTQVDGTYDTFDVSSLTPGQHVITIESPSGNIYEGTFTTH